MNLIAGAKLSVGSYEQLFNLNTHPIHLFYSVRDYEKQRDKTFEILHKIAYLTPQHGVNLLSDKYFMFFLYFLCFLNGHIIRV